MSMLEPSTLRLAFPIGKEEKGILLMTILEDYIRNADYSGNNYDDLIIQQHIFRAFSDLKMSGYGGTAQCYVTIFCLECIEKIVRKYSNSRKEKSTEARFLAGAIKDMIDKSNKWAWC